MDVVVTVPRQLWWEWLEEGDLPGEPESDYESHFMVGRLPLEIKPGERVYVAAHGRLRGYAPLIRIEERCQLNPSRSCLVRAGGAVAVTIRDPIIGFRGVRYVWWDREDEMPFPEWQKPAGGSTRTEPRAWRLPDGEVSADEEALYEAVYQAAASVAVMADDGAADRLEAAVFALNGWRVACLRRVNSAPRPAAP